jgi:hypothetical protein
VRISAGKINVHRFDDTTSQPCLVEFRDIDMMKWSNYMIVAWRTLLSEGRWPNLHGVRVPPPAAARALKHGPPPIGNETPPPIVDEDLLPKHWLQERISAEQAEVEHMSAGTPFGGLNAKWQEVKAAMRTGDELWSFCSPPDSWRAHAGRSGIALVRDRRIVRDLVTRMN